MYLLLTLPDGNPILVNASTCIHMIIKAKEKDNFEVQGTFTYEGVQYVPEDTERHRELKYWINSVTKERYYQANDHLVNRWRASKEFADLKEEWNRTHRTVIEGTPYGEDSAETLLVQESFEEIYQKLVMARVVG